ncbi:MAG: very short patch repair endonuclease [Planctomycetota bacterium]
MDVHTKSQRSFNMSKIRARDTKPEMIVRSIVHAMGYRFRLHDRKLPGTPDLVFRATQKVIFVHGCFWHCHQCRYGRVVPATNTEFWRQKRQSNVERDRKNLRQLRKDGWRTLVIWECWTRSPETRLIPKLISFLSR